MGSDEVEQKRHEGNVSKTTSIEEVIIRASDPVMDNTSILSVKHAGLNGGDADGFETVKLVRSVHCRPRNHSNAPVRPPARSVHT
jgi:hypothetical protein